LPNISYGLPTGHSENGGSATCSWLEIYCVDNVVKTTTIEITEQEGDLVMGNYSYQLYASNRKSNGKYDLEISDVDKFRNFLNDKIRKNFTNCKELIEYNRFNDIKIKLDKEVK